VDGELRIGAYEAAGGTVTKIETYALGAAADHCERLDTDPFEFFRSLAK